MFPHVERKMEKGLPYGVGPRDTAEDHTGEDTDTASMKLGKKASEMKSSQAICVQSNLALHW